MKQLATPSGRGFLARAQRKFWISAVGPCTGTSMFPLQRCRPESENQSSGHLQICEQIQIKTLPPDQSPVLGTTLIEGEANPKARWLQESEDWRDNTTDDRIMQLSQLWAGHEGKRD